MLVDKSKKITRVLDFYLSIKNRFISFFEPKTKNNKIIKFISVSPFEKSHENFFFKLNKNLTKEFKITNKTFADYYIIINHPYKNLGYFNPKKTIVFQNEPEVSRKKWGSFYNPKKDKFLKVYNTKETMNMTLWHIKKSIDELREIKNDKPKEISSITSSLYNFEGHKKRLNFLKFIDDKINIDIYGGIHNEKDKGVEILRSLANYKGHIKSKDNGLLPYKYHIASENSLEDNYFTEKIVDPIMTETLCFYWGCPNLENFIDSRAFIRIDLDKPEESLEIIKESIKNDEWSKRLPYIKKAKEKIINELHFFNKIKETIEQDIESVKNKTNL